MHDSVPAGAILVLGGTAEGRELANAFTNARIPFVSSLAGRVSAPRLPAGPVRIGGFGGVDGLAEYIAQQNFSAVIDATHPFAAGITGNAAAACARTGTRLLVLRRPAWVAVAGDDWTTVPDLFAANAFICATDPESVVLLTTGRQEVAVFAAAPQRFWLRAVDPPDGARPARCELILDRGPFTLDGELELFRRLELDLLVTKNSGGPMTSAKLAAARELGLPVLMVERPSLPSGLEVVDDVVGALAWATKIFSPR